MRDKTLRNECTSIPRNVDRWHLLQHKIGDVHLGGRGNRNGDNRLRVVGDHFIGLVEPEHRGGGLNQRLHLLGCPSLNQPIMAHAPVSSDILAVS